MADVDRLIAAAESAGSVALTAFRARYGEKSLPGAEAYYARTLSLPLFPAMADAHVDQVVLTLAEVLGAL